MIFRASSVAKYESVVGDLSSAIVPEELKGNGHGMHGVGTMGTSGTLHISDSVHGCNCNGMKLCLKQWTWNGSVCHPGQVNMHCVQWERGFGCVDIETIQTVLPTHAQNLAIVFILVSCLHMGGIRRIARIVEGS